MVRFKYRLRMAFVIFLKELFSPFIEKSQLFYFLSIPILVAILGGFKEYILQAGNKPFVMFLTVPVWILICIIIAFFKTFKQEKELGYWDGNQFIFQAPFCIKTVKLQTKDNAKCFRIKIKELPKNSFVNFKVDYQGGLNHLRIKTHENSQTVGNTSRNTTYGVRINSNKEFLYEVCAKTGSVDTICYISLLSWKS